MGFQHIRVRALTGALGAEVEGVSLAVPVFAEIQQALVDFGVLCFREQELVSGETPA